MLEKLCQISASKYSRKSCSVVASLNPMSFKIICNIITVHLFDVYLYAVNLNNHKNFLSLSLLFKLCSERNFQFYAKTIFLLNSTSISTLLYSFVTRFSIKLVPNEFSIIKHYHEWKGKSRIKRKRQ